MKLILKRVPVAAIALVGFSLFVPGVSEAATSRSFGSLQRMQRASKAVRGNPNLQLLKGTMSNGGVAVASRGRGFAKRNAPVVTSSGTLSQINKQSAAFEQTARRILGFGR